MSTSIGLRLVITLGATVLFVVAGVSFLGIYVDGDLTTSQYHAFAWLSFGLAAVSMSLFVAAFDEGPQPTT